MPDPCLSAAQARSIAAILEPSPAKLARTLDCSAAQARALQQYLVLIFVGAHRRSLGEPWQDIQRRAGVTLHKVAPRLRREIIASLAL